MARIEKSEKTSEWVLTKLIRRWCHVATYRLYVFCVMLEGMAYSVGNLTSFQRNQTQRRSQLEFGKIRYERIHCRNIVHFKIGRLAPIIQEMAL